MKPFVRQCAAIVVSGIFLLMVMAPIKADAQSSSAKTIAVLYFENNSVVDKDKLDPLKKGLADMMITELSKIKSLRVVERRHIQSIIDELNLNETDMVDKSTTQKMGKLLGAEVMLFGGFSNLFKDQLRIDVRIVRTETGETLKADEETGELDEFLPMLQSLVKKIAKDLDVKLSSSEEDQLEAKNEGKFSGYVKYAQALNYEDQGRTLEKNGKNSEAKTAYENAKTLFQKAVDESEGYEPAKQKAEEMAVLISKLKK